MDKNDILSALVEAIHSIEEISGQSPSIINADIVPLRDLDNFDSLRGLEVITELQSKLGVSIDETENPFLNEDGESPLTIDEVVERVHSMIEEK